MVPKEKANKANTSKKRSSEPIKIEATTPHGYIDEFFTPFGGFLLFVKMLAALQFENLFENVFIEPERKVKFGHYFMLKALIFLLVIGFQRIFHFSYISQDAMLLGVLGITKLPAVSTFWRWLISCSSDQAFSLVKLMALIRERVWWQVGYAYNTVHIDIDTTVETVYGDIEGARKGHNPKHRGKKGLRPVLIFLAETKEYLTGKLRAGSTMSGKEVSAIIKSFKQLLPGCVTTVIIRADSEFYSQTAVTGCEKEGYYYIISVKVTEPVFDADSWYSLPNNPDIQYNSCVYKPKTWDNAYRFVAMRIRKSDDEKKNPQQSELFEDNEYKYRIFITNLTSSAHELVDKYDGRAGAEPLIGEARREGLCAIPSKKFEANMTFFQIVMLTYNLWRHMQSFADANEKSKLRRHTVQVARLKMLFLAAKIIRHSDQVKVKYSQHLDFRPRLDKLFEKLDALILNPPNWDCRVFDRLLARGST
ncbi:MAG: IS1380 family transposase [bacterium]|nr:MAG: IS1380 family transposase [bacterium]